MTFNFKRGVTSGGRVFNVGGIASGGMSINGKSYTGKSVNMIDGVIYVDGVAVDGKEAKMVGPIKVEVTGNCDSVTTSSGNIAIHSGDVKEARSTSGDITVGGDVTGNASSTSGDVRISGSLGGNASSISGDVNAHGASRPLSPKRKVDDGALEEAQIRIATLESEKEAWLKEKNDLQEKCLALVFHPEGEYAKSVVAEHTQKKSTPEGDEDEN